MANLSVALACELTGISEAPIRPAVPAAQAYVSTISNPLTDACALHAMRLISTYLPAAVENGEDMAARDHMSYAQFLAGERVFAVGPYPCNMASPQKPGTI